MKTVKQRNPGKRITQFADTKWLQIELGKDVLRGILRNWNRGYKYETSDWLYRI